MSTSINYEGGEDSTKQKRKRNCPTEKSATKVDLGTVNATGSLVTNLFTKAYLIECSIWKNEICYFFRLICFT